MPQSLQHRLVRVVLAVMIVVNVGVLQATRLTLAASLTSVTDVVSNQEVSASANHTFAFTTPSGVSDGETITITFDGDYDVSAVTEDDVDVSDDAVQLTTANNCLAVEQASVAIVAQTLTITICAGDGGTIAGGSEVQISIGTNAVNSGIGSNQIVNPDAEHAYPLSIAGTFGDSGYLLLATTEPGSIDVELTVDQIGGGGGGGGGGGEGYIAPTPEPGDTTDPIISGVDVSQTTTTATVTWNTDETTSCSVDVGETTLYGDSVAEESSGTSHSVELTGLSSDTEYFFLITCEDESGNASSYGPASFTTQTDSAPSNVSSFACSAHDASIGFSWNMPADDDLAGVKINCATSGYPATSSQGLRVFTGGSNTTSATAGDLTNGTLYRCTAFAYDSADNEASGAIASCTPTASEVVEEPLIEEPEVPVEVPEDIPPTEPTEEVVVLPPGPTEDTEEAPTTSDTESEPQTEPISIPSGPTTEAGTGITSNDVSFTVAGGSITISPDSGVYAVIPNTTFTVQIPDEAIISKTVDSIYLTLDDSTYLLGREFTNNTLSGYTASLTAPATSGTYTMSLRLVFTDGSTENLSFIIRAVTLGYVYGTEEQTVHRLSGAAVTLLQSTNSLWDSANVSFATGQSNPTVSANDGTFAWYSENGLYRVEAVKAGYEKGQSAVFRVSNNIASTTVLLQTLVAVTIEPTNETPSVMTAVSQALAEAEQTLEAIRQLPQIQTATEVAVPVAVVLATVSAGVLATSFDLLPLIQYFITSPFVFFGRRKRKSWGVVYNAATKLPIDLAIIRLYHLPENRLIATRVTDKEGRYFFLSQPGDYRLEVLKPSFHFPTTLLKEQKTDGDFLDVYHGETIRVSENNATIAANVPVDPSGAGHEHDPAHILKRRFLGQLTRTISPLGFVIALALAILHPGILTLAGLGVQLALFALSQRLAKGRKPKSWGIVYASDDKKPVAGTVVRIFEPLYNKLLETVITDNQGRYSFLVGPATYFTTYEKKGYQKKEVHAIDTRSQKGPGTVAIDVPLTKATAN